MSADPFEADLGTVLYRIQQLEERLHREKQAADRLCVGLFAILFVLGGLRWLF
jgi:hypothetical protein